MKKTSLLGLLVFGAVSMQAQKVDESAVPTAVKTSFQKAYPAVKTVKWEKEKSNYEANFKEGGVEESVAYEASGKFISSEKVTEVSALPGAAIDYFAKNLPGKKIKEASEIKDANGVITYEAEVNEVDYTFDASGKYLKQEADED